LRELAAVRWAFLALVAATTLMGSDSLWSVLRIDTLSMPEGILLALFTILFAWISTSFWIACVGAYAIWSQRGGNGLIRPAAGKENPVRFSASRTAIVMPVHNEDARRLFAGLRAIHESVADAGAAALFDFYVLSDSTDPACWLAEELEWWRWRQACDDPDARIFYRHRPKNTHHKSGNIADFCRQWGSLYDYMVVLDADSLMTGDALVRLVALMDANPAAALIQAPPQLIGRNSLFARMQQFASSVYGPVFSAGLALLQGPDGNYWGHNAIVRVAPFMQHCGLPQLPGDGPLSGEIMSHDFVEAALLRRAGWEVRMAPEVAGSYEEPPPTVVDHLKRDRRWCHGNLQHLRVIPARGLRLPSRLHLAFGVMGYLSAPLWAAMMIASAVVIGRENPVAAVSYRGKLPVLYMSIPHALDLILLMLATAVLLYGPKLLSFFVAWHTRDGFQAHGGPWKAAMSLLLECAFSTLAAPIFMLSHSRMVAHVLTGAHASWSRQRRDDGPVAVAATVSTFAPHTAVGVAVALAVCWFAPGAVAWFTPLVLGLVLAIPLVLIADNPALGRWVARRGLFATPVETHGLAIADRMRRLMADNDGRRSETGAALLRLIAEDPAVNWLHRSLLADVADTANPSKS
jgi:membrane glycosyltransferase